MASIKVNHINYILPGDKQTIVNLDVEYQNQFTNQTEKKTMSFVIDTESDVYDINTEPFAEVESKTRTSSDEVKEFRFNNRHSMLYGQDGKKEINDIPNQQSKRADNLGRAIFDIKDVALKSAVASQIIDPNQKEQADVDDGFIEIYSPHLRKDPLGFCQVKNYSYGISDQTKIAPVLHQTTIKKSLLEDADKAKETVRTGEFYSELMSNNQANIKQSYSYYLNPRDITEEDDSHDGDNYEDEIQNSLPTYTYIPLKELKVPKRFTRTLRDIIGNELSSLLSVCRYNNRKRDRIVPRSPLVGINKNAYDEYILSAENVINDETYMLSASFPLDTLLGEGDLILVGSGQELDGYAFGSFSRTPTSYHQFITSFGNLSNDVISSLLIPKYNSIGMEHNYIFEVPLSKETYNKYDIGIVQGDLLVGKNAYDALYTTNISAVHDWHHTRDYVGIGSRGGKIYMKFYDDVEYDVVSPESVTTKGLDDYLSTGIKTDLSTKVMEKINKEDEERFPEEEDRLRSYQKVEVLDVINRFITETKHKANLYNVNINGLKTIIDKTTDENREEVEKLKLDIKNSIRNVLSKLVPAHTQMFGVTFRDESKLDC